MSFEGCPRRGASSFSHREKDARQRCDRKSGAGMRGYGPSIGPAPLTPALSPPGRGSKIPSVPARLIIRRPKQYADMFRRYKVVINGQEAGSIKWAGLQLAYMSALAYVAALVTFQGLRAAGLN